MLFIEKNQRFLQNGSRAYRYLKSKNLVHDSDYFSSEENLQKINTISKIYADIFPILKSVQKKYNNSLVPGYLSYGLETLSDIKRDFYINPLNHRADEQIKKIDKKHFLTIGAACLMLSVVNLDFKLNLNELSHGFNIKFNFSQPNSNPTNDIVQSLQPQFMTSIFKNKTEAFTKLLGITEGKANFFYKDNLGIATAYGWNPTKNSKEFNVDVAHKIGMSNSQIKSIEQISNNSKVQSVPQSLKKVVLTDRQIQKSAEIMLSFYESELLDVLKIKSQENNKDYSKALKAYHSLPNNQQVVMVHMAFKVGKKNLLKYNQFFNGLFNYMDKPTAKNLERVTANINYSFKTRNGNRLHDTRVEQLHTEFFNECSIKEEEKKQKEAVQKQVKSCRNLVASKTIKITNKG